MTMQPLPVQAGPTHHNHRNQSITDICMAACRRLVAAITKLLAPYTARFYLAPCRVCCRASVFKKSHAQMKVTSIILTSAKINFFIQNFIRRQNLHARPINLVNLACCHFA